MFGFKAQESQTISTRQLVIERPKDKTQETKELLDDNKSMLKNLSNSFYLSYLSAIGLVSSFSLSS